MSIHSDFGSMNFIFFIKTNLQKVGPDVVGGQLRDLGIEIGEQTLKNPEFKTEYDTVEDFLGGIKDGTNPLVVFDTALKVQEGYILLSKVCPYAGMRNSLEPLCGGLPECFGNIAEVFNKYGEAVAVPFCITHQAFRNRILKDIKISKKQVRCVNIGCRDSKSGNVAINEEILSELNKEKDEIERMLMKGCLFSISPDKD